MLEEFLDKKINETTNRMLNKEKSCSNIFRKLLYFNVYDLKFKANHVTCTR